MQLTSQIQYRCQYGQTRQKSCTASTLTVRNGEAVTHHFSYDRPVEKQMGSARGCASYYYYYYYREDTEYIGSGLG